MSIPRGILGTHVVVPPPIPLQIEDC